MIHADTSSPLVRGIGVASVAVALAGLLAVVASGDGSVPPAGARVVVDGRATVVHLDGSTDVLSTGDVVRAGEEVRADAGSFVLELAGGGEIEGRAGFGEANDSRVVVGERPEVVAGEVLVRGADGLDVDAAGTIVTLDGDAAAARVDRRLAVRAAAYTGALEIDSAGQAREVPALRQLSIASLGRPPASPEPIRIDDLDPWDRRYLGGAIDLNRRLETLSRSVTRTVSTLSAGRPALYESAVPSLAGQNGFDGLVAAAADAGHPAGEILVGAVITSLGRRGPFTERWDAVFDFRGQGAGWGLVALDQQVGEDAVLDAVDASIDRLAPGPEIAAPPPGGPATPGSGGPPVATPTTSPPTTSPPTSGPPTTEPPPTLPPPTVPPPTLPPDDDEPDTGVPLLDDVVEPIDDLLDGLLG